MIPINNCRHANKNATLNSKKKDLNQHIINVNGKCIHSLSIVNCLITELIILSVIALLKNV